jgi:hypothetical protein
MRHSWAWLTSDDSATTRRWLRFAAIGVALNAVVAAMTFVSGAPRVPGAVSALLILGLFPLSARSVLALPRSREKSHALFLCFLPRSARLALLIFVLACFTALAVGAVNVPGGPVRHGGSYYFNFHGALRPTDKAHYQGGIVEKSRTAAVAPMMFFAVNFVVNLALLNRRRARSARIENPPNRY